MSQTKTGDNIVTLQYVEISNSDTAPSAPSAGTRLYARTGTLFKKTSTEPAEAELGGGGDVDYGADNLAVRSDGTNTTQATGITVSDAGALTGVNSIQLDTGVSVSSILDEDALTSNSATALATQQSIRAYASSSSTATLSGVGYATRIDIVASDIASSDFFGFRNAISGDGSVIITGSSGDDDDGSFSGSAYIYSDRNYQTETKLTASDAVTNDFYGSAVALNQDGTVALVGAQENGAGAAYVYSGANYATETILTASDGASGDDFGVAVDLDEAGTTALVGSSSDDDDGSASGSAYVFNGSNFGTETKLTASDGTGGAQFGISVSISGDGSIAVVGASRTGIGAVYVYSGVNFATETKLTPSDGVSGDRFGDGVAISGDGTTIVVGALRHNSNAGAVYVYNGSNFGTETKITASNGASTFQLGSFVAVNRDGSIVAAGSKNANYDTGNDVGFAYVYSGTNFADEIIIVSPDVEDTSFGDSVALSDDGTRLITSSTSHGTGGKAYVYTGETGLLKYQDGSTLGRSSVGVMPNGISLSPNAPQIIFGDGAPSLVAPAGTIYLRSGGSGSSNTLYIARDTAFEAPNWVALS